MSNRRLPSFTTGVVTATNGERTVTGSGTQWVATVNGLPESQIAKGDRLRIGNQREILIDEVVDATELTLAEPWPHTTAAGSAYEIIRYVALPTGAVLAALQQVEQVGTDTAPKTAFTFDAGGIRAKLRQSAGGLFELAVGATGSADADLVPSWRATADGRIGIGGDPGSGFVFDAMGTSVGAIQGRIQNKSSNGAAGVLLELLTAQAGSGVDLTVLNNAGAPAWYLQGKAATDTGIIRADSFYVQTLDGTTDTERLVLNETGLGLGMAPAFKVDVALGTLGGTSGNFLNAARLNAASNNDDAFETVLARASTGTSWASAEWILRRNVDESGLQGELRFGGDYSVKIFTQGAQRLKVDTSGFVGIGKDPTVLLDVGKGANGFVAVFGGVSKGARFTTDGTAFVIEGVDQTGAASYQPLQVGGSLVSLTTSGTVRAVIDEGLTLGAATGGDQGAGTLNAEAVYENGHALGVGAQTGAIGQPIELYNNSGGAIAVDATASGSVLHVVAGITTGFEVGSAIGSGTYRNISGGSLAAGRIGKFRRIA